MKKEILSQINLKNLKHTLLNKNLCCCCSSWKHNMYLTLVETVTFGTSNETKTVPWVSEEKCCRPGEKNDEINIHFFSHFVSHFHSKANETGLVAIERCLRQLRIIRSLNVLPGYTVWRGAEWKEWLWKCVTVREWKIKTDEPRMRCAQSGWVAGRVSE